MRDRITLRFLASPTDETKDGNSIQAGRVLEWIDKAGYACAAGYSGTYCVTAYVGNVEFKRPIRPGDLIEATAQIIHTGRTSMQILVVVESANPRSGEFELATHCLLVFVAKDADGRPTPVPPWRPRTSEDERLAAGALERIETRKRIHELTLAQEYTEEGTGPELVLRFLANPTDINWGGNVHGGFVMRWITEAAQALTTSWQGEETICVYSGGIHFHSPMHIGDLVEVHARVIHTTARSMHVAVHVRAADPRTMDFRLTTRCLSVFVQIGDDARAASVRQLALRSDEDRRLS
ncbi:MAG: hotdog domain-containing protein, partial [bacterium]|nr:hotdog domain-containing protein [bacterium]